MAADAVGVKRVGVLGSGLMGSGIGQASAAAGYPTVVRDVVPAALERGRAAIASSLTKLSEKGKLPPAGRDAALARLTFTTDLAALADCDLVIEAVTEDLELKRALLAELDPRCPPATIFASNTSSLTIGALAAGTSRPDRFLGLHFFNPVPIMPLVEVVRAITTSAETFERGMAFVRSLGKEPVAARDTSGFLVNLLLVPYLLDAVRALERRVGSVADLDLAMRLGAGHPMGPFTLLDFVGIDTTVRIAEIMFDEYRETRYAAPPLLRRMALAGLHGRKTGRGFYDYTSDPPVPVPFD
ncbi:MAG TPA: 3-hydroxyacyl-CoA dehydrogenase family protein [Gemmatimonadales bacterium]|nr:3-hydroxyacyl-CoA dehydrogenase family protein [Gemmatimonadales bacterium]